MTKEEAYEYFDEHWTDYNSIHTLLDKIFDHFERRIAILENVPVSNDAECNTEVERLKRLLKACQDRLDEETHQLRKLQESK